LSVCRRRGSLRRACRVCERGTGRSEHPHGQRSSSAPAPELTPRSQRDQGDRCCNACVSGSTEPPAVSRRAPRIVVGHTEDSRPATSPRSRTGATNAHPETASGHTQCNSSQLVPRCAESSRWAAGCPGSSAYASCLKRLPREASPAEVAKNG
jgi:hypothetical protein